MKKHSLKSSQNASNSADSARVANPPKRPKACGCSGMRWCRGCLDPQLRRDHKMDPPLALPEFLREPPRPGTPGVFEFDPETGKAPGCPDFEGMCVIPDFLSTHEAAQLLEEIESSPFVLAQSGKQKQHFGAKVNFNKKKLNTKSFRGLPRYAKRLEAKLRPALVDRMRSQSTRAEFRRFKGVLARFVATDLFVLRYQPGNASNLDFHIDDNFAYGEAIIDLSLESNAVMTFLREVNTDESNTRFECIRVPLLARSAAVLFGAARYEWEHAILHYDISDQRTSITLRSLSEDLRDSEAGRFVMTTAESAIP